MEERCIQDFGGETDHLLSSRRRWENNIKMDPQEVGWGVCIGSSWRRIERGGGHL